MRSRGARGFTLFELLIVIGVLGVIAAFAIPSFIDTRYAGNEGSAGTFLRTLYAAETQYQTRNAKFATIAELSAARLLQPAEIPAYTASVTIAPDGQSWTATATPVVRADRLRHFYVDLSGVVRFQTGAPADASSSPL